MHRHSLALGNARAILGRVFEREPNPAVRAALLAAREDIDHAEQLLIEEQPELTEAERTRRANEWQAVA